MTVKTSAKALAVLGVMAFGIAAHAADGEAITQRGGANPAALPCMTCHGIDGKGLAAGGFPRLAGLPAPYIAKQLADFRSGARANLIMQPIAKALSDDEIAAVAEAYAARPKVNVKALAVKDSAPEQPQQGTGAWLALRGDWQRNIPECTLCHGPSGIGVGATFPPLTGQSASYIEAQLLAMQGSKSVPATRRNDPNGLMRHIAASLSKDEIKSVAAYFSSFGESTEPFDESQHRRLR